MRRRYLLLPPGFLIAVALLRPASEPEKAPRCDPLPMEPVVAAESAPPGLLLALLCLFRATSLLPEAAVEEPPSDHRKEVIHVVADRLELAFDAYLKRRFARCVQFCDDVLLVDPTYEVAARLKSVAARSRHARWAEPEFLDSTVINWSSLTSTSLPEIPSGDRFQVPSSAQWSAIRQMLTASIYLAHREAESDPEVRKIFDILKDTVINFKFENTSLVDILSHVREITGLNILLDARVRDRVDPDRIVDFHWMVAPLSDALRILCSLEGLEYLVVPLEEIVLLTSPENVANFHRQN